MRQESAVSPSGNAALRPESVLDYQTADARWFDHHPDRQYRFRKPYIGEPLAPPGYRIPAAPPGFFVSVIVAQIKPGVRTRARLVHSEMPNRAQLNSDAWIAAIHQEFCPGAVAMKRKISAAVAKAGGAS